MAARSRSRSSTAPSPSLAPIVLLVALAAAGVGVYLRFPGLAVLWIGVLVAAWMEPAAILTGRKDSSGYPSPANSAEEKKLGRYRVWRDLKFRMLFPGADILPGWPILWSWLIAVTAAGAAVFVPVKLPVYRLIDALAVFLLGTVASAARRRSIGPDHPGTRVDAAPALLKTGHRWFVPAVVGVLVGVTVDLALVKAAHLGATSSHWVPVPVALYALIVLLCLEIAVARPLREMALADWRELVASRAQWDTRWAMLKRDPAPELIGHRVLGTAVVDTFQAPGHEGSMAYLPLGPKIAPTLGAGMRLAVLEVPDEGPQGPIPASQHPVRFEIVSWPVADIPNPADPDADTEIVQLFARCAMVWALEPLGYARLCLLSLEKITENLAQPESVEPDAIVLANDQGDTGSQLPSEIGMSSDEPSGPVEPSGAAWVSQWFSPIGLEVRTLRERKETGTIAARFGCEVLIDHRANVIYFGALTDPTTRFTDSGGVPYAQTMAELANEDRWSTRWGELTKHSANPPVIQHGTYAAERLADGSVVHRQAFVTRQGVPASDYFGMESALLATLAPASYVAITGWPTRGQRPGERHPQAICVYWSEGLIPVAPDALAPSNGAQWALAGRINQVFEAVKLPRPEIVTAHALTRRNARSHIWEIQLRLYGGVTMGDVRTRAERLRQAFGTPWLRVAEAEDGCVLFVGVSPLSAELANPAHDGERLVALDWEQAWLDAGVRGSGGTLPRLVAASRMPHNPDVHVLTFALPPGLDITMLREATKKLSTATGNEYVEVRKSPQGPKAVTVLACTRNPMPELVPYDFSFPAAPGEIVFATGIDGEPVIWRRDDAAHLLAAGTTGSGKAQPLTSTVPVPLSDRHPTGQATIGDLSVGDQVLSADGIPTTICGLSPIEDKPVFEVVFSDGQVIECSPEHLWRVSSAASRRAWAPRELLVRDANSTAATQRAEEIRRTANSVDPGLVATRQSIAALAGVSLSMACSVAMSKEPMVPIFVATSKPTTVFDMAAVMAYMRAIASMLKPGYPVREMLGLLADRVEGYIGGNGRESMSPMSVITTEHMYATQRSDNARVESNYAVRIVSPYDPAEADLPVSPYLLGAWLGDGASSGGCITVGHDDYDDMYRLLAQEWPTLRRQPGTESLPIAVITFPRPEEHLCPNGHANWTLTARGDKRYCVDCSRRVPGDGTYRQTLGRLLRRLGVLGDKHIPAIYVRASYKQRLSLLQGLMDTDGTINCAGSCELSLCSVKLATGALELIRSLGIKASMSTNPATITEADPTRPGQSRRRVVGTRYRIKFTTDEQVFRLPRKAARLPRSLRITAEWNYVVEVRRTERVVPMRCLSVDSPDHTYLTGGYIPTHNSALGQAVLYGAVASGCDLYVIDPTKGAADFNFLKPYARVIVGLDAEKDLAEHLLDAAATLKAIYAEGLRRRKLNVTYGVGSYRELPEEVRPRTAIVFIDEFVGLIGMDKVQRQPFDDPEMEYERQVQLATNMAKLQTGQFTSKIAAEARAWGIHLILGTQKLPAKMLDQVPNGSILKSNLARILLGKTTPGDRMSALRIPDDYPEMGDLIGKGRGVWEPLDDSALMIQAWYATQSQYSAALAERIAPLNEHQFLDASQYRIALPERDDGPDLFFPPSADATASTGDADSVLDIGEMEFSLDDLTLDDDTEAEPDNDTSRTPEPDGADRALPAADGRSMDASRTDTEDSRTPDGHSGAEIVAIEPEPAERLVTDSEPNWWDSPEVPVQAPVESTDFDELGPMISDPFTDDIWGSVDAGWQTPATASESPAERGEITAENDNAEDDNADTDNADTDPAEDADPFVSAPAKFTPILDPDDPFA